MCDFIHITFEVGIDKQVLVLVNNRVKIECEKDFLTVTESTHTYLFTSSKLKSYCCLYQGIKSSRIRFRNR